MADVSTITGIRKIFSDSTSLTKGPQGGYAFAASSYVFEPSVIWAHAVLEGVREIGSNAGRGGYAFVSSYTQAGQVKYTGNERGIMKNDCTNVTFGLEAVDCQARMIGVIYFLTTLNFKLGKLPDGRQFVSAVVSDGGQDDMGQAGAAGDFGRERRTMVVLYDRTSGVIVHTHQCVSLGRTKHMTKSQLERDARQTMQQMAAGRPLPKDVSVLHVDPHAIDAERHYRVDPKRRVMVKTPIRKPPAEVKAKPRARKGSRMK
ncbi:MAG: hypothetical protein WA635_14410 [Gallionella sp.]